MKEYCGTCIQCGNEFIIKDFSTLKKREQTHGFDLCPTCLKSKLRKKNDYNKEYRCEDCGNVFQLKRSASINRKSSGIGFHKCPKCLSKTTIDQWSPERKLSNSKLHADLMKSQMADMTPEEKLSFSKMRSNLAKSQWDRMSEDDRNRMRAKMSEGWKNMTEESRDDYNRSISESMKKYYTSLSDEERQHRSELFKDLWNDRSEQLKEFIIQSMRDGHNKWWDGLSDSEKKDFTDKNYEILKMYQENMSIEDRIAYYHKIAESNRSTWKKKSDIELKEHSERSRQYWNSLPESEKQLKIKSLIDNYKGWWKNINADDFNVWAMNHATGLSKSDKCRGITESKFSNDLSVHSISYEWGYASKILHPNFYQTFPINPYTNGKVSPYHAWDFRVGNILIDIDGSEHTILPKEFITKDGIDVGGLVQFNDSQRPYQTDGMDAYIILAYNDRLEKDTAVYSLHENICMLYQDLINILIYCYGKEYKICLKNQKVE